MRLNNIMLFKKKKEKEKGDGRSNGGTWKW